MASEHYISMYLASLKVENYSPLTIENYRYQLAAFSDFLGETSMLRATTMHVREYLAHHQHLKASTIVTKLDVISGFYNWLILEEEILKNPCAKIKRPKLPKKVKSGLTIVELEQVRNSCKTVRERALIEVFYSTGCRLDELRKLNIEDIDWSSQSVLVFGKGSKERRVFLSDKASWYLRKYLKSRTDDCEALFATVRTPIRRLTNDGIAYQIRKIKEASGIERDLTPHIMRHTFAQLSLDNGMKLEDLQSLMGHESPATTMRYAESSDERKQMAFKMHHAQ